MQVIPPGPVFSVVTPFTESGSLDRSALENYLETVYGEGGRTFYAMAFNSRYSQMSHDEIVSFNDFVCRIVKGLDANCVAIVGDPVACSTATSIEVAKRAGESGADLFSSLFNERYYSDQQVIMHYQLLARKSPIPLLIHQMPLTSGYGGHLINWPTSTLERVLSLPGVAAMKEDSKDSGVTSFVLHNFAGSHAIVLSGGGKRQFLRHLEDGAKHWLNGIGVFAPHLSVLFSRAINQRNQEVLQSIVNQIEVPFFDGPVKTYGWHLAMRSAIEHQGFFPRYERLPLLPLNDQQHADVGRIVTSLPLLESIGW